MIRYNRVLQFVCACILSACSQVDSYESAQVTTPTNILKVAIPESRTVFGEKEGSVYPIYWDEDDCISVNGVASQAIEIDSENRSSATFDFGNNELTYPYAITYPHTSSASTVTFPTEQQYTPNSILCDALPMCGYSDKGRQSVSMKHLASILRISMKSSISGVKLKTIHITASERSVAGEFVVDCKNATITPTDNSTNTILYHLPKDYTLSCSERNIFYIAVASGNLGSCKIVLTTESGNTMQLRWETAQAKAGVVHEFADITYTANGVATLQAMGSEQDSFLHRYKTVCGYVRDTEQNPIAGVSVSDGFTVVTTNNAGYYEFDISQDAWYVYISIPAEYKIPTNSEGLPCFFKRYPGTSKWFNFTLERLEGGKEREFMLFALADPQTGKISNVQRFATQVAPEVRSYSASLGKPCYGITLGDIISMGSSTDISQTVLPAMQEAMHADKMGMPIFQVMGNHDNCFMNATHIVAGKDVREINLNIQRMFEEAFGPINYSFNRGDAHIIGMRNVQWKSGDDCSTDNTRTAFTEEQYKWLVADLAQVKKDKAVVLCVHIPLYNNGKIGDGSYRQEVLTLLDDFAEAHVLSGHLHYQHNYDHNTATNSTHKIYEHAQAAINGASWSSNINGDGVPNGYGVYHFDGNTIKDWYYKGYAQGMNRRDYQIRLYRGNAITGAAIAGSNSNKTKGYYQFGYDEDTLLANVFNSDTNWKVEVYEDGVYSGKMTSLSAYHWDVTYDELIGNYVYDDPKRPPQGVECGRDFWAVGILCGYLGANNGGLYYKHCYQMWKYKLKNKNAQIEVRATDRKGNIYTCSTITDGRDMTYALYNE